MTTEDRETRQGKENGRVAGGGARVLDGAVAIVTGAGRGLGLGLGLAYARALAAAPPPA